LNWSYAAAALLLVGLGLWLATPSWEQHPKAKPVAFRTDPKRVAVVLRADGAEWDVDAKQKLGEGTVLPVGTLKLRSGRATLALVSGVLLFLEGPVSLDLQSAERVFCHQGKLRTRVPPGAEGFTVLSPGAAVVDLGTEFGFNVEADGRAELMVFEGKAEVSVLNADGYTLRNELLHADRAVELNPTTGVIRNASLEQSQFVAAPDLQVPNLDLDPSYPDVIREAEPWGYWRFESLTNHLFANDIPNGMPLRATGPLRLAGTPGGNQSVVFKSNEPDQSLTLTGYWKPPRGSGYAVEIWMLSETFTASSLLSLIARGNGKTENHTFLLELTAQSRNCFHEPCVVRFLERWPPGTSGGANVFSRRRYVPLRWHHLVAQKVEDRLELYLDGRLHGIGLMEPTDKTTDYRMLIGRLKESAQAVRNEIRPFVGRFDELALYEHPLSAQEVLRHYELGSPTE
jgi:hypothetical protein